MELSRRNDDLLRRLLKISQRKPQVFAQAETPLPKSLSVPRQYDRKLLEDNRRMAERLTKQQSVYARLVPKKLPASERRQSHFKQNRAHNHSVIYLPEHLKGSMPGYERMNFSRKIPLASVPQLASFGTEEVDL